MRLDKYLKLSRIIKRRTLAKDAATHQKVEINNKVAKPSSSVTIGDKITLHLGRNTIEVEVTSLTLVKGSLMYILLNEEKRP
jgi:ribosomal 50S subunit-recycling heat shock protein